MITKQYAKANNRFCETYNRNLDSSYLIFLDQNNFYGWAMSQSLPVGDFRWLSNEEVERLDISSLRQDDPTGMILEVDLQYPQSLHDSHDDYPLAPEKLTITEEMLSGFQMNLYPAGHRETATKLTPNLYDKKKYVVHDRNLQFYLKQGLELEKIHRVISFSQSD